MSSIKETPMRALPEFFREIEKAGWRIDQAIGAAIVPKRKFEADGHPQQLSPTEFRIAKRLFKICGKCFGVHLADFFETKTEYVLYEDNDRFPVGLGVYMDYDEVKAREGIECHIWPARNFTDGVMALYRHLARLPKSSHFKKWLAANRPGGVSKTSSLDQSNVLEKYLKEECGAPYMCFSGQDWPAGVKPSAVVTELLAKNYD